MKKLLYIIVGLIVLAIAWYLISPAFITVERDDASPVVMDQTNDTVVEMDEDMPDMPDMPDASEPQVVASAEFMASAHEVAGRALLIEGGDMRTLRFEDFDTINGPNLHIYLAADLDAKDYVDLGEIRATKGNVNYEVAEGIDLERYNKVLVWCKPFKVLFSYAELEV